MSDAIQIVTEANPNKFIAAGKLNSPMLSWFDQSGLECRMPMPTSFVAFPVDDDPGMNGVHVIAITDARVNEQ